MKSKKTILVFSALLLITYSTIVLLIPFKHSESFWLSFVWNIIGMVVGTIFSYLMIVRSENEIPIYEIATIKNTFIFIVVLMVVGAIVMLIGTVPFWVVLIVYLLISVAYIAVNYVVFLSQQNEQRINEKVKSHTTELKLLTTKLQLFSKSIDNLVLRQKVEKIHNLLMYSDPIGNEKTEEIEKKIIATFEMMQNDCEQNECDNLDSLCRMMENLIEERNAICKMYK